MSAERSDAVGLAPAGQGAAAGGPLTAGRRDASAGGPLTAVLSAFEAGARSFADVAARCDLPLDTVRACVDHLVRMGRLEASELAVGCPSGGCGSCASGVADAGAGCGSSGPSARRAGPVLVAISVPHR